MADPLQTPRATALEIPVTVQGSKTVEGSDQRELFTETTKTILVSENGAVLQLSARLAPGQCVFLRNDQSGSEILCKVIESRQAGSAGYTDLEFTSYNPRFWDHQSQQPGPAAAQRPAVQKESEAAVVATSLAPGIESGAPAGAEVAAVPLETSTKEPASPSPETIKTSPEQSDGAGGASAKDPLSDWDAAKDAELLAVLAAMDRESKGQQTKKTKDAGREKPAANDLEHGEASSSVASETTGSSTAGSRIRNIRKFTAKQNPISIAIAASIVIAVVLGVGWRAKIGSWTHKNNRLPSTQSALQARPTTQPSQSAASATATSVNAGQVAPTPPSSTETPKLGTATAQGSPAAATDVAGTQPNGAGDGSAASAEAKATPVSSDPAVRHAARRKSKGTNTEEIIPAKIVSQAAPAVPPWAKGLDVDLVVQLNALIDEKGNLVETKPISGPRWLQPAAQRAVALWVFAPALSNGKPTASHMLLTVQFQK